MNPQFSDKIKIFSFPEYLAFVGQLGLNDSCTGEYSEEHKTATKVYSRRMKRLFVQAELTPLMKNTIELIKEPLEWVVLTESWCGDGAYSLPVIAKIAGFSDKIKLSLVLRNENPELMNAHLTNGSQSIPKLICIKAKTGEEMGSWGPRPGVIQSKVERIKESNSLISKTELWNYLHMFYSENNGKALQNEFIVLINKWIDHK